MSEASVKMHALLKIVTKMEQAKCDVVDALNDGRVDDAVCCD